MCTEFTLLLALLQSRAAEASSKAASGSGGVWRRNVKDRLQRMSVANMMPEGLVLSRYVKASAPAGVLGSVTHTLYTDRQQTTYQCKTLQPVCRLLA